MDEKSPERAAFEALIALHNFRAAMPYLCGHRPFDNACNELVAQIAKWCAETDSDKATA